MIKTYFKTAWRSISRYKTYSIINILGLTLGIASCIVIFLVVKYELGYESFNKKADRIYRVTLNAIDFNPSVSMAIAPAMRTDFQEIEQVSQVWYQSSGMVKLGTQRFEEKGYIYADEYFSKIFDYTWLSGDATTALSQPNSVVFTETMARKYFGDKNPIGKVINLDNQYDLKVTGVIKDVPGNTHLPFIFAVSFETVKKDIKGLMSEFYAIAGGSTYILLPEKITVQQLQKKIPAFIEKNWGKDIAKEARLPLQPLKDIHFDQRYLHSSVSPTTSKETYWALSAVALFIIVIACINFVNLATAQAIRRAKEVGVRKVLGSSRAQLIAQFLGETGLMVIIAVILGLSAAAWLLPTLATWLDIKISFTQIVNPFAIVLLVLIIFGITLLAGLYPAFVQSAFLPVHSLKKQEIKSGAGLSLRKSLVVVQFCISQVMIVGTLIVAYQMDFFQNRNLGFNKEAVVSFGIPDQAKRELLMQQLTNNPGVKEFSFSSGAPAYSSSFTSFASPELGITKGDVTEMKFVDEKYTDMFDLKMLAGEKILKTGEKDTSQNAVVNETMIHKLNITDPQQAIGKHIMLSGRYTAITGVVQDFQSESKHKKIRPCALLYREKRFFRASVRLQSAGIPETIAKIDKAWTALFPDELFRYEFLDDHIATWYTQEHKQYVAFKMFSFIAILIGCLGLYGLVAFAAAQRAKEVGIRKVLGASMNNIIYLFSKEFVVLIAVAFLIAAPVAYYVMHNWLENFAYQVSINWTIFAIAIGTSFLIAGCTIAYQAIKAAVANPVKSLRSE